MSIRKRTWVANGETKEAWVVDYVDSGGKRRLKTFSRKRDAETHNAIVAVDLRDGVHTADRASPTVEGAGRLWLKTSEQAGLERTTMDYYRQHLDLHITPLLGAVRLSQLTAPMVRTFEDELRETRSPAMVRKAIGSLGAILADAQERGLIRQNVVHALRQRRTRGKERRADRRQKGKLKIGIDIPAPDEIKVLIPKLEGRWKPLVLTATFTGLRASELRGLRWIDVDLKAGEIHVRQRADRFNVIGRPKSEAGERTVPIAPMLMTILREWKLACPKGELGLVFPSGAGGTESLSNILQRGLQPAMIAAGLVKETGAKLDPKTGKAKPKAKYTGLHALRHFYASWCINRRVDGGLELPLKVVQARMGHSSIQITADRYGHLFPRGDDSAELAAAEKMFLG
jgi:integrase